MTKIAFSISLVMLFFSSCEKAKNQNIAPQTVTTDSALFQLVNSTTYKYYENDNRRRTSVAENGSHGLTVIVKFNQKAFDVLDDSGKLPVGMSFPDSSLIVKEAFYGTDTINPYYYAAMLRLRNDKNNASGWVWGEYQLTGAVLSTVNNGSACVPCHSRSGNRDMVRTFEAL